MVVFLVATGAYSGIKVLRPLSAPSAFLYNYAELESPLSHVPVLFSSLCNETFSRNYFRESVTRSRRCDLKSKDTVNFVFSVFVCFR